MRALLSLAPALALGCLAATPAAQEQAEKASSKVDLAVLYVGTDGGPRTDSFVRFLGEHFREVGTAVYPKFQSRDADAYDVVVLDVEMKPSDRSIGIGPQPQLPKDYARATVLVNGPGVIVADRQLESKIGWY